MTKDYADLVLPLALSQYFTYEITPEMKDSIDIGSRVVVPFGKGNKFYTGIVVSLHNTAPKEYETKAIYSILDPKPILRQPQLKLWEWIADYYMCSVGEVFKAAIPAGLKIDSETQLTLNNEFVEDESDRLNKKESAILDALSATEKMTVGQIEKSTKLKNLLPAVRGLMEKMAIVLSEEIKFKYKPKVEPCVRMTVDRNDQDTLREIFDSLMRSQKQLAVLMKLLELSRFMHNADLVEVTKKDLLEQSAVTAAVLKSLETKGYVEVYNREVTRLATSADIVQDVYDLNEKQQVAFDEINTSFKDKQTVLLHGVTSSGKTEVYIHLIKEILEQGKQALLMVPEIALTTQLSMRLERVFGKKLAIYHSKFSDNERVEIWKKLLETDEVKVVLGVRSSVFLPFNNLGLIIVDEEHEPTFKQQDPAPRYHGRNVAMVLASLHGAKTLLGTATPSVESYYNATTGKYGLVELTARHQAIMLPEIVAVNTQELKKRKQMISLFSPLLLHKMNMSLQNQEQAILFQNRRGFAPMIECDLCAWVPKCIHCDVSLTYHKGLRQLTCHYCGYSIEVVHVCPACGNPDLVPKGFGTEKIEEEITRVLPSSRVVRMDLDTTRTKSAYERIITNFQQRKSNVLIGTQMISKGLDFDHVKVVGILNADSMLNFPDFRAHERAFQMLTQVAGRAGRKHKQGEVIIQTSQPEHKLIRQVINNDYKGMYAKELDERKAFKYPPFYRLIYIYMKHKDEKLLNELATTYANYLRRIFGNRVLGPDNPPVARVQSLFIRKVMLKVEIDAPISRAKEILLQSRIDMLRDPRFKSLIFYYDVDPL